MTTTIEPTVIARTRRPELAAVSHDDLLVDDLGFESLDVAQAVADSRSTSMSIRSRPT